MIEKITDQNLERYDSRLKEWCDRKFFEKGNYGKYETTGESGAVSFYPAPNTPLEGKVKFSFKEIMPASGNKGPENPSTITGVSSVQISRTNKNLLSLPYHTTPGVRNGITWTVNSDGSITATGTAGTGGSVFYIAGSVAKVYLASGKTYFLSGTPTVNSWKTYIVVMGNSGSSHYYRADLGSGGTFVPDNDQLLCFAYVDAGVTVENYTFYPQIEEGIFATSFDIVPRIQNTISLGSTYYGGEIDLVTGVMTVNRVVCELDGTEWWSSSEADAPEAYNSTTGYGFSYCILKNKNGYEPFLAYNSVADSSIISCTHFPVSTIGLGSTTINNGTINFPAILSNGNQCRFSFQFSTVTAWKNYLAAQKTAGTPVKVVYLINDPYTVQLSPIQILSLTQTNKYMPRLNTVYTDADSIQISYLKSPIRDEYEKTQAILSLGGNS